MFKGLKKRLAEKREEKKAERKLYKETYKEELAKRKTKAIKLGAKKQAVAEARKYARAGGRPMVSKETGRRVLEGFDKFGKHMLENIDPSPQVRTDGSGFSPFPQDPMVRKAPHKKKKRKSKKQKTIVIKLQK